MLILVNMGGVGGGGGMDNIVPSLADSGRISEGIKAWLN